jgi:protoporphyrinogen oxidase
MDNRRAAVAIVGGGLAGLTAAVQLARWGIEAVLFEETTELGGRAKTDRREGFHLNYGPHCLYDRGAAVRALRGLGIAVVAAPRGPNGGLAVWRRRTHTLPTGFCSLLVTDLFTAHAKREIARLMTSFLALRIDTLHSIPIAEWLRTQVSDANVIEFVLALVRYTTYCDDSEALSAAAAIDQLRLSLSGNVLYIARGWQTLVATLEHAATVGGTTIMTGRRVVAVNTMNGRAESVTLGDGTTIPTAAVIISAGPKAAQQLLDGATTLEAASAVRVAALDVALRSLPQPRVNFAFGIDEPWCFSADSSVADVAPDGSAVVHMAKYLKGGALGNASDEHDLERALDLLQPGWRGLVVHQRFLPACVVSHALVAANTGGFAGRSTGRLSGLANVFVAGDWVGPTGQLTDAAVASAVKAARRVSHLLSTDFERHGAF